MVNQNENFSSIFFKSENRQLEVKCFPLEEFSFFSSFIWNEKKLQNKAEFEETSEPSMVSHKYDHGHPLTEKKYLLVNCFTLKVLSEAKRIFKMTQDKNRNEM